MRSRFWQSTTAIPEAALLDTKLIFVEGIPGSGKTNTAEFLCSQLERNRIPAAHIHEKDPNHPTRMEWQGEACRIKESLERWRDFASSRAQSDSVTVLDGQLFHRNTAELFFNDVELVTIENYVRGVIDAVSQLNPTIVYLVQSDVPSFMRRTCDDRGDHWENTQINLKVTTRARAKRNGWRGFAGYAQLYTAFREMTDELIGKLDVRVCRIDMTDHQWPEYLTTILSYLSPSLQEKDISHNRLAATYGDLCIFRCDGLHSITQCETITNVARDLKLIRNPDLLNLDGLNVERVSRDIYMLCNDSLQSIASLNRIKIVPRDLRVDGHPKLASLEGLHRIESVDGRLLIVSNHSLRDLQGLRSLQYVSRGIHVTANNNLAVLDGLQSLKEIGGFLYIRQNEQLESLEGLEHLAAIGGHLEISNNPRLRSLRGLKNLTHLGGRLIIGGNEILSKAEIDGFVAQLKERGFSGDLSTELLPP